MKLSHLTLLVFLSQVSGLRDLLLEELEPLLAIIEIRPVPPGGAPPYHSGHSLVYSGSLTSSTADYLSGDLLGHNAQEPDTSEALVAAPDTVLLHLSSQGVEQLLRNEPELGMLLMEQLRSYSPERESSR